MGLPFTPPPLMRSRSNWAMRIHALACAVGADGAGSSPPWPGSSATMIRRSAWRPVRMAVGSARAGREGMTGLGPVHSAADATRGAPALAAA